MLTAPLAPVVQISGELVVDVGHPVFQPRLLSPREKALIFVLKFAAWSGLPRAEIAALRTALDISQRET